MRNFRLVFTIGFNATSFAVGRTHKVTISMYQENGVLLSVYKKTSQQMLPNIFQISSTFLKRPDIQLDLEQ
jgi:hypothetical protein